MSEVIELRSSQIIAGFPRTIKIKCLRCERSSIYTYSNTLETQNTKRNGQYGYMNHAIYHCGNVDCGRFVIFKAFEPSLIQTLPLPFND